MTYCKECHHSATYHPAEGVKQQHCISWGCDCPGWNPLDRKPENYKERPKWNT